ncbi:hypothetical protein OKA04_15760 [Luteolibacter flavescens]|uniref:Metallopeptidase n=1 Tax=Luteolibacter flavescens TaxID=1859460 RepID=A0ABT3FRI5_9BACT|nr:hypothetical protein [Luteolibacter flavescens]MCW1886194.1 hypothetical protein [Luteolibacter flavescens]
MSRYFRAGLGVLGLCLISPGAAVTVENFKPEETVRHSVILIRGTSTEGKDVSVKLTAADGTTTATPAMAAGGKYKALVELSSGVNKLELTDTGASEAASLTVTYQPMTNPHHVRLIWLTDSSGATDYAAPEDGFPQNYEARVRTAALLMQCFTAERMHELGYGRRTFALKTDENGKVKVETIKSPHSREYYHGQKDDQRFWRETYQFLNTDHADPTAKNLVLAAFTRKDPATGRMLAHTALGGGNLGLFGSASVFSWPDSLANVQASFTDGRRVDATRVHDDSAGRNTWWALASTTLGATLHEMGHTFDLPHCKDPRCIMTRGFDGLNRFFTFSEPWPNRPAGTFRPEEEAWFAPVSASFLRWNPWFQPDAPRQPDGKPEIRHLAEQQSVEITAPAGVRVLGFWEGDDIRTFREFRDEAPAKVTMTREEIRKLVGEHQVTRISAMDDAGRTAAIPLKF